MTKKQITDESYFTSNEKDVRTFSSGCTMLDQVLGGGWAVGRVTNIIGDKSAGKSLLAIEACANFVSEFPNARVKYVEAEAAFDVGYAEALGLPVSSVDFASVDDYGIKDATNTVEGLHEYLVAVIDEKEENEDEIPTMVIIDSLDAFSDRKEQEREIDKGTYGQDKAKKLSEMFRRLLAKLEKNNINLIVVSQIRDKIGVTFGEKTGRSGGRALDFYCSQVIRIAECGKLKKTIKGVERPIGVKVKVRCTKNKVGLPFRDCAYCILFGYGIWDIRATSEWLNEIGKFPWEKLGVKKGSKIALNNFFTKVIDADFDEYDKAKTVLDTIAIKEWNDIEKSFLPKRGKYRKK